MSDEDDVEQEYEKQKQREEIERRLQHESKEKTKTQKVVVTHRYEAPKGPSKLHQLRQYAATTSSPLSGKGGGRFTDKGSHLFSRPTPKRPSTLFGIGTKQHHASRTGKRKKYF